MKYSKFADQTIESAVTNNPNPRVDILLATFNGENYLADLLSSVFAQSGFQLKPGHLSISKGYQSYAHDAFVAVEAAP